MLSFLTRLSWHAGLLLIIWLPCEVLAARFVIQPLISVSAEYDDNILFSRVAPVSDLLAKARPALGISYQTERLAFRTDLSADIWRYLNETELNVVNQYYTVGASYHLWEKFGINGNFSYVKDTTLESELLETGVVRGFRDDRESLSGTGGISYNLTDLSRFSINYSHSRITYDSPLRFDYDADAVSIAYEFESKNQLDRFSVLPGYSRFDSDRSTVDNLRLSFGWSHPLSETLHLNTVLGGRYTVSSQRLVSGGLVFPAIETTETDFGGIVNISLQKTGLTLSGGVTLSNDLGYTSEGEAINVSSLTANVTKRIDTRLGLGIASGIYYTRSLEFDSDSWYFFLSPSLSYNLTLDQYLAAAYEYQYSLSEGPFDDDGADRNRIWLTYTWRVPERWME